MSVLRDVLEGGLSAAAFRRLLLTASPAQPQELAADLGRPVEAVAAALGDPRPDPARRTRPGDRPGRRQGRSTTFLRALRDGALTSGTSAVTASGSERPHTAEDDA